MAGDDDNPKVLVSSDNHHEFVVVYGDETRGPFASKEDAMNECSKWIDAIRAERDTEKEKQRQLDEYLWPYHKAMDKIKDRNDRRRENGIGQRESDRRKKIAKELEGFEFPYPPIEIDQSGKKWFAPFRAKVVQPTREVTAEWRQSGRYAANKYRKTQLNRAKQPDATRAARDANADKRALKRSRDKERDAELRAQGKTNEEIANDLGLSVRHLQRLRGG